MNDDNTDFCYECNCVTEWSGEQCNGCGRFWGYPLDNGVDQ